jgi:hypothetical protein
MAEETNEHVEGVVHKNGLSRDERDRRGRFRHGHGGRKPGARNRATVLAESLIAGESEQLVRKAIEVGLEGNVPMLTALLRCMVGPVKERSLPLRFRLPPLRCAQDAREVIMAIMAAGSDGTLDTEGVRVLMTAVDLFLKLEARLVAPQHEVADGELSNDELETLDDSELRIVVEAAKLRRAARERYRADKVI